MPHIAGIVILLLLFTPFFMLIAGLWTTLDAARRGQNWFAWGIAVSLTGVASFVWLVARRRFGIAVARRGPAHSLALVVGLLFMVCLQFLLIETRRFLVQIAKVEEGAMSSALNDRDRVIVDKSAYRRSEPRRGEIVMLLPARARQDLRHARDRGIG